MALMSKPKKPKRGRESNSYCAVCAPKRDARYARQISECTHGHIGIDGKVGYEQEWGRWRRSRAQKQK